MGDDELIVDPKCAIDALQQANASGTPHTIKYKLYSGTRFYYVEEFGNG